MEHSTYHKLLRISMLVVTTVLLFQAGLVSTVTARYALDTQHYMANAVGVFVGVAPNELNLITADLTKREMALAARESAVTEREIDVGLIPGTTYLTQQTTTLVLAGVLLIILMLLILNYILDYRRWRARVTLGELKTDFY